jgi:hypothetical protein
MTRVLQQTTAITILTKIIAYIHDQAINLPDFLYCTRRPTSSGKERRMRTASSLVMSLKSILLA